jgi:RHS repeat-associated protein
MKNVTFFFDYFAIKRVFKPNSLMISIGNYRTHLFTFFVYYVIFQIHIQAQPTVLQWQKNYGGSKSDFLGGSIDTSYEAKNVNHYVVKPSFIENERAIINNKISNTITYGSFISLSHKQQIENQNNHNTKTHTTVSIVISAIPSTSVCSNTPVTLTATGCSGNVTWSKDGIGIGNGANIRVSPIVTTTYNAICNEGGNSSNASYTVTVEIPFPIVRAWDKTYGGTGDDYPISIGTISGESFFVSGQSSSPQYNGIPVKSEPSIGGSDYWLSKIDASGTQLAEKTFQTNKQDRLSKVLRTIDNAYLLVGWSNSDVGGFKGQKSQASSDDIWLLKVNDNFTYEWSTTIGGSGQDIIHSAIKQSDGGFILAGTSNSTADGETNESERLYGKTAPNYSATDFWLIKVDQTGKKIWDKSYGGTSADQINNIIETSDGNLLLIGESHSLRNTAGNKFADHLGKYDYWIVKVDREGNYLWDKSFGGTEDDAALGAVEANNGNYIIYGYSNSPGFTNGQTDILIFEIRPNGDLVKEINLGGTGIDIPAKMLKTNGGGYLLGGTSNSNSFLNNKTENSKGGNDSWIIAFDQNLNRLWDKTYGGTDNDYILDIALFTNNQVLISSASSSPISADKSAPLIGAGAFDFWIQKCWINAPPKVLTANSTVCNGQSTQLEASNCPGIVSWSNGLTGNIITVTPLTTTSYTATCTFQQRTSCSSEPVIITVCQSGSQSTFGYTSGNFQATDGGAAVYSIPIVLPSGSAGVKPELGLTYNSQGGNGVLGVGWSLDGLQVINRSSKTRAQDEAFDFTRNSAIGISLSKEDRYSLNGSRLVLAPNSIQTTNVLNANYGKKGTEYYTEQNQFIRVTISDTLLNGAPKYFLAHTKDGLILEFGNSLDSRVDSKEGVPITYLVNKISDRNGNYIRYYYETQPEGTANSVYPYGKINTYPLRIEYTANDNSGAAFTAYNKIEFEYIPRTDKQWSFIKGSYIGGGDQLISKIKVSAKNIQGNYVEVRRYEMTYIKSKFTGNSLLYQVKECADTLCHEPTVFNWQNEEKTQNDLIYKEYNSATGPFPADAYADVNRLRLFGDWDGDGTNDLFVIDKTTGIYNFYLNRYPTSVPAGYNHVGQFPFNTFPLPIKGQFRTVDFNVDGKTDIFWWNPADGAAKIIFSGFVSGQLQFMVKDVSQFIPNNTENGPTLSAQFFQGRDIEIVDWNQDGITDLVSIQKSNKYYSIGSDIWLQTQPPVYTANPNIGEVVMKRATGLQVPNSGNAPAQPFNRWQIADFNNDGLNDVCLLDTATANISIYKMLSNKISDTVYDPDSSKTRIQDPTYGVSFENVAKRLNWSPAQNKFIPFDGQTVNFYNRPFFVTDVNGDGLPDISVKMSETSYQFQLSTGNFDFFEDVYTLSTAQVPLGGEVTVDLTDFNNDGNVDLLTYNKAGLASSSVRFGGFDKAPIDFSKPLDNSLLNDLAISFFFGNYSKTNLNDLLFYKVNGTTLTSKVYNNNLGKSDLIGTINEGSGQEIQITYKTLKDPAVYTRTATPFNYPLFEFTAPISVVASVRSKNGIGGYVYTDYQYEGAFSHSVGRGFRGFSKVINKDRQRNIYNIKFYNIDANKWWLAGQPFRTEMRKDDPVNGQLLSLYEATFEATPYTISTAFAGAQPSYMKSRSYYTYGKISVARTYDLNTTAQTNVTISRVIQDAYGNSTKVAVDHGDGVRDSTVSQYTDNVNNWILGRLTRSTAFRFSPGKPTSIRTVAFEYNAVTGQLTKEVSDPDSNTQIKRETIFSHDTAGNIVQTEVKAWNGTQVESRITQFQFDSQKRLKQSTINPLGHQSFATFNVTTGSITTSTDINGLTDTFEHDAFQRIIKVTDATGVESIERFYRAGPTWNSPANGKFVMYKKQGNAPAVLEHYDILGRMIRMDKVNFSGNTVSYTVTFNNKGEKTAETGPGENKAYQYDLMSRVTRMTDFGEDNTYEYIGNQTTVTDIKGRKRIIEKNSQGQLLNSRWQSSNGSIANQRLDYEYDGRNNPTRVVGNTNGFDVKNYYDARGYKTKMEDPVMGTYRYENNGFGEMTKQTDPKGNIVTMEYDKLGRVTKRTEAEGITTYLYDTGNKAKGKLTSVTGYGGIVYAYTYDNFGRTATETKTINAVNYVSAYQYTTDNKIDKITYPSGLAVKHEYNAQDYLYLVRRVSDGKVLWRAKTTNAVDNILTEDVYEKGVGQNAVLRHTYTYDADLAHVTQYRTFLPTDAGTPRIQKGLTYDNRYFISSMSETVYSGAGQVMRTGSTAYNYDDLDQLTAVTPNLSFPQTGQAENTALSMTYDSYGNIRSKSDVGNYVYDQNALGGPRYLTRVDLINPAVCIPSFKVTTDYTSFNKVRKIANDSSYALITYGPDYARVMQQLYVNNKLTKTKIYVNSLYEVEIAGNQTRESSYIRGGSGVLAVETKIGTVRTIQLWVKDHANNLVAVVDTNGTVLQHLRYDVWGRRMKADLPEVADDNASYLTDRGFTKHEHIDLFQLINMNGRIYDPIIARFISPDPFIGDALDLQAYNRYAYVQNNPVMFTDPSGYFKIKNVFRAISKAVDFVASKAASVIQYTAYPQLKTFYLQARFVAKVLDSKVMPSFIRDNWRTVVTTAATIVVGTLTAPAGPQFSGAAAGFTSGFLGSAFNGGSYKDAVTAGTKGAIYGAAMAYLSNGVGDLAGKSGTVQHVATKTVGHAVVQGTMAEVQGGNFWDGAKVGAISGATGDLVMGIGGDNFGSKVLRTSIAATIGGTTAAINGGKFSNGAISAAMTHMYNDEGIHKKWSSTEAKYDNVQNQTFVEQSSTNLEIKSAPNLLSETWSIPIGGSMEFNLQDGTFKVDYKAGPFKIEYNRSNTNFGSKSEINITAPLKNGYYYKLSHVNESLTIPNIIK